jgi:hypothetical protein
MVVIPAWLARASIGSAIVTARAALLAAAAARVGSAPGQVERAHVWVTVVRGVDTLGVVIRGGAMTGARESAPVAEARGVVWGMVR